MTISEFRDVVVSALIDAYPDWYIAGVAPDTIEYHQDPESFDGENAGIHHVNYGYFQYLQDPSSLDEYVAQVVRIAQIAALESPGFDDFHDRLVILLRPDDYLIPSAGDDTTILSTSHRGDLIAAFFLDSEDTLTGFPASQLEETGLTIEEATDLAKLNLSNRMGEIIVEQFEGLEVVTTESGLAAGLPLLEKYCTIDAPNNAWWLADRNTLLRTEFEGDLYELDIRLETMMATAAVAVINDAAYSDYLFVCLDGHEQLLKPGLAANE